MSPDPVAARVAHLSPQPPPAKVDPEKVQADLEAAHPSKKVALRETPNPQQEKEYSFDIELKSRWYNKVLKGRFVNRVLSVSQRRQVGVIKSRLLVGAQTFLDQDAEYIADAQAHLTVSLVAKPIWFDPQEFEDHQILGAIYQEAASHEATFWRPEPNESI